jgi:hypothetical protein
MTLLEAMADANLFAPWFRDRATWAAWTAFIAALFALPMTPEQLATYQQCTGRTAPPTHPATESYLNCGRRSGKSFLLALCAVYLSAFHDYRRYLAPGERATVLILATNAKQARVIFRYVRALLTRIPMLAKMVQRETADAFDLTNGTTIEVHPVSMRTTRGYTIACVCADEIAYWPHEDAAEPDYEVLNALRPGMATIPNAKLLCASSPYARRGVLWDAFRRHYGKDNDPVLVWKAPTRVMNPTVSQQVIDAATEADPVSAASEYGAEYRSDIESFINREAVTACISYDVRERAPCSGTRYFAFVDPSGGSVDSMTMCVGHRQGDVVVVDALRERKPPFSPEDVVAEFSELAKSYNKISKVVGDKYAGEWPRERFRERGLSYEPAQKPKSDLYRDLLPLINSRKIDLLDDTRLLTQLVGLERRTARGTGRDVIDHAPGAHDDLANCVAGLAAAAAQSSYTLPPFLGIAADGTALMGGPYRANADADAAAAKAFQDARFNQHIRVHSGYYSGFSRWR